MTDPPPADAARRAWIALAVVLLATFALRARVFDLPLDRDEGEYAYAAQELLRGSAPYEHVYNMKLPGIYAVYAAMMGVFGESAVGIHVGLALANALSALLVFLLGRRLAGDVTGVVAAASFSLLALDSSVQGLSANAEHFVLPPALAGLLLLAPRSEKAGGGRLFLAGLLLGSAVLVKQHGAAFALAGAIFVTGETIATRPFVPATALRRVAIFAAGGLAPIVALLVGLGFAGVLDSFRRWAIDYGLLYAGQIPLRRAPAMFAGPAGKIYASAPVLWTLAAVGLAAIPWTISSVSRRVFAALVVVSSCGAILPGFFFRPHYFVLLLPAAALLVGLSVSAARRLPLPAPRILVAAGLAGIVFLATVLPRRAELFEMSPVEISRATYGLNPFPESREIARYLAKHSDPSDRIAVLGSEPQILFEAGRRSATGYIYMYPLMESQPLASEMQREMIAEVESARPRFLVHVHVRTSWLPRRFSPQLIFEWVREYKQEHYEIVGLVNLLAEGSEFQWGPDVVWPPSAPAWIEIWKRRG